MNELFATGTPYFLIVVLLLQVWRLERHIGKLEGRLAKLERAVSIISSKS